MTLDHIRFNEAEDGHAIAELAKTSFNVGVDASICRLHDDERLGGVIFTNFTGESIGMHSGSWDDHWINRDLLWVSFHYPFEQLGVKRIFGQVPEDNVHAQRFNEKLGFRYVARVEGVYRHNIACLVMRLDKEDCRFLGLRPRGLRWNREH